MQTDRCELETVRLGEIAGREEAPIFPLHCGWGKPNSVKSSHRKKSNVLRESSPTRNRSGSGRRDIRPHAPGTRHSARQPDHSLDGSRPAIQPELPASRAAQPRRRVCQCEASYSSSWEAWMAVELTQCVHARRWKLRLARGIHPTGNWRHSGTHQGGPAPFAPSHAGASDRVQYRQPDHLRRRSLPATCMRLR